jgi:RNA polymerase sigma-70 factor (ECF subfamily)
MQPPTTHPSLLVRLRGGGDHDAWTQFVQLYAPLVYGFARRRGLQDADAADLTQEVMRAVHASVHRLEYDPARGSFRGWLFTIAYRKLHDFRTRQQGQVCGSGDTAVQDLLAAQPAAEEEEHWNEQYERRLFTCAAEQVRPCFAENTWQAFWRTAVAGESGQQVAEALGMSVAAVYLAKSRVMARLREQIQQWEAEKAGEW